MPFQLKLVPHTAAEHVLENEIPISGVEFLEKASALLRKSIDGCTNMRHITLGTLSSYTINIPDDVAIRSGKFENNMSMYVVVENDLLKDFIFYTATMMTNCSTASVTYRHICAPYNGNGGVLLHSNIDELAFVDTWVKLNYPETMTRNQYVCTCGCV